MKRLYKKPARDPELATALRSIEVTPLVSENDMLRRRILVAARTRLASLSAPTPCWWELVSARPGLMVPVGFAAALAAVLLMPGARQTSRSEEYARASGSDSLLVMAALSEDSGARLTDFITPPSQDWLLGQAMDR